MLFFQATPAEQLGGYGIHLKLLNIVRPKQKITSLLLSLGDVELGKKIECRILCPVDVNLDFAFSTSLVSPGLFSTNSFGIGDGWSWKDLGHTDKSRQTEPFKQ